MGNRLFTKVILMVSGVPGTLKRGAMRGIPPKYGTSQNICKPRRLVQGNIIHSLKDIFFLFL